MFEKMEGLLKVELVHCWNSNAQIHAQHLRRCAPPACMRSVNERYAVQFGISYMPASEILSLPGCMF